MSYKWFIASIIVSITIIVFCLVAEAKCIYCGSSEYGKCTMSNVKVHQHKVKDNKCVFCGVKVTGQSQIDKQCPYSPNGKHVIVR